LASYLLALAGETSTAFEMKIAFIIAHTRNNVVVLFGNFAYGTWVADFMLRQGCRKVYAGEVSE